jgi:hypothetical protein
MYALADLARAPLSDPVRKDIARVYRESGLPEAFPETENRQATEDHLPDYLTNFCKLNPEARFFQKFTRPFLRVLIRSARLLRSGRRLCSFTYAGSTALPEHEGGAVFHF